MALKVKFEPEAYAQATDAHRGVSFDPEKSGAGYLEAVKQSIEATLMASYDLAREKGHAAEYLEYAEKAKGQLLSLSNTVLARRGRTVSWAITGRGNFPVARNEKAMESERSALDAFSAHLEKVEKTLRRIALGKQIVRVGDAGAEESATLEADKLEARRDAFKAYNVARRKGVDQAAEMLKSVDEDTREAILDYVKYNNGVSVPSFALTNLNAKIKRLRAKAISAQRVQSITVNHIEIDGALVSIDREANRLRVEHENRPEESIVADLKANGFRWSPYNQAWQTPVTLAAVRKLEMLARKWAA